MSMSNAVKARVVKMGNSKGIRIPKTILEQPGLGDQVELSVCEDLLAIRPSKSPRADWEQQLKLMAERGDDRLLDEKAVSATRWDVDEWQW